MIVTGRPQPEEAAAHFANYIALVKGDNAVTSMERQLDEMSALLNGIGEEQSLVRYAEGKWSIRELLSHVTDTERSFAYRALWFGRGFTDPMLGFDQTVGVAGAEADRIAWRDHVEEFRRVRLSTLSLFQHLPQAAWARGGVVNGHPITVRALSFIVVGHAEHHARILREHYL